jgi:hypothetical protein
MVLEIQVRDWDRHKNVAGLHLLMRSQLSPLIIGSPTNKQYKKPAQILFHSKRSNTMTE